MISTTKRGSVCGGVPSFICNSSLLPFSFSPFVPAFSVEEEVSAEERTGLPNCLFVSVSSSFLSFLRCHKPSAPSALGQPMVCGGCSEAVQTCGCTRDSAVAAWHLQRATAVCVEMHGKRGGRVESAERLERATE